MKQEDKDLLFKDLCARLPYKVKVFYEYVDSLNNKTYGYSLTLNTWCINELEAEKATIKPYLRPMSSMTEEEKEELYHYYCNEIADNLNTPNLTWEVRCCISNSFGTDWLNAHHFDYRGLIPLGLAIEVTKENNPYKEIKL